MFVSSTVLFGALMGRIFYVVHNPPPGQFGWCGNSITDPTSLIMNIGVPTAVFSISGLSLLARRRVVGSRSLTVAIALAAICTAGLIGFRIWLLRTVLEGAAIPVWWIFN